MQCHDIPLTQVVLTLSARHVIIKDTHVQKLSPMEQNQQASAKASETNEQISHKNN